MNNMKRNRISKIVKAALVVMALVVMGRAEAQQLTIPGTKVKYSFPSKWEYLSTHKIDANTQQYLYYYSAQTIAANGDTTLPFLRIVVRKNYSKTVFDYVFERYSMQPYQSLSDYTEGLGLPKAGGMGYIGAYTNLKDRRDYQFRMVYFKEQNTIVEFRLETTHDTYPLMEQEFENILKTLTF